MFASMEAAPTGLHFPTHTHPVDPLHKAGSKYFTKLCKDFVGVAVIEHCVWAVFIPYSIPSYISLPLPICECLLRKQC